MLYFTPERNPWVHGWLKFSMSTPRGISFTTDSFTVGWDNMVNKDKASVLEYDLQV